MNCNLQTGIWLGAVAASIGLVGIGGEGAIAQTSPTNTTQSAPSEPIQIGFATQSLGADANALAEPLSDRSTTPSWLTNQPSDLQLAQVSIPIRPLVEPTHWAYQAVTSLVERYGCISGYPDGTFRGDQAITRYEAAAAFSACFDNVIEVIETDQAAQRQELEAIRQSMQDLQEQLGVEERRIEALEGDDVGE
ncbi:MAG: iron uptake porin [Thainema sp.]